MLDYPVEVSTLAEWLGYGQHGYMEWADIISSGLAGITLILLAAFMPLLGILAGLAVGIFLSIAILIRVSVLVYQSWPWRRRA